MSIKKDLYNLHCRVKHSSAEFLKFQSEEVGISVGEVVDFLVEEYVKLCDSQDEILEQTSIHDILSSLVEKVDRIEQKVGA